MKYIVNTPCGPIQGCEGKNPGVAAYKGIRYATAGRWEYPVQVKSWEGTYDATAYGSCSYQPRAFYDEELNEKKYFYYNEFRKGEVYDYSEDCLFLNVFTPDTAKEGDKLPVLVYIHGGGFTGGCGHEKHFDEPVLPMQGVIGVTLNYRLGPMGFACLPNQQEEEGHTGNFGLYDQLTALKWVKDNIAAFGGDPENVTIMGQSAGAMSVQFHCQSPLTEGLFQKAILSSGCGMSGMMTGTVEKSVAVWQDLMARSGCQTLEEFRALPAEDLFNLWQNNKKDIKNGGMAVFPVKDGCFCVDQPNTKDIAYMAGSTSHDMAPPILYSLTKNWIANRTKPSYLWYFDRMLPGDKNGAWHSSDLWYWFGTLSNGWRPWEVRDQMLTEQMVSYVCNFAKTGDPNGKGLPTWRAAEGKKPQALLIGEGQTRMGKPNMGKMIVTMLTNKAVGE